MAGYPGRTQRHQTYSEVKETTEWRMPRSIRLAQEQLAILDQLSKQDKAIALKVAGRVQGLNNGLTNQKGMLEGLVKGGSLAKKQAQEKDSRPGSRPTRPARRSMATSFPRCAPCRRKARKRASRPPRLMTLASSSSYLGAAQTLYRLSVERPKPDIEREAGFQQRDWPRIRDGQDRMQRTHGRHRRSRTAPLGAGPGRRPAGRTADRRLDQAVGLQARNVQGRRRRTRSTRICRGCLPAPDSAIASSAWA